MNEQQEQKFLDWFHETESCGMRCERFGDDVNIQDEFRRYVILLSWLREAFNQGLKAAEK